MSGVYREHPPDEVVYTSAELDSGVTGARITARRQGTRVGELEAHVVSDSEIYLAWIWVRDDWRGRGIATALFTRTLEMHPQVSTVRARAETAEGRVFLDSMKTEHPTLNFYVLDEVSSLGDPESREEEW